MSVLPPAPPAILLDPATFVVDFVQGGAAPEPLLLNISSRGSGNFSWNASANTGSGNPVWLSLSSNGASGPGSLQISVDASLLSPGQYRATVDVSFVGSSIVRSAWVVLNVYPPGATTLSASRPSLTFHSVAGGSAPATQRLWVASSPSISWAARVLAGAGNWLAISKNSGITTDFIDVSVNSAGLAAGTYTAAVELSASGAANNRQVVPVTLVVHLANAKAASAADAGSLLFVAPSSLSLPPPQLLPVKADPEKGLEWTAIPTTANGLQWLSLSKNSGTTPDSISVSVNPSELAPGVYRGAVALLSAAADNWRVSVPVILLVDSGVSGTVVSLGEIAFLELPGNFQAPIGAPLPVQVYVRDSKGQPLVGARVNAQLTTGHSFPLAELGAGAYGARWTPTLPGPLGIRVTASKGSYAVSAGTSGTIVSEGADPISIFADGLVNAAFSLPSLAPVAPGSLISIFGSKLSDSILQSSVLPVPTAIGGIKVLFDDVQAPILYGSPGQFNVQVPFELEGKDRAVVRLERSGVVAFAQDIRLTRFAPAIFTLPDLTQAAVLHNATGSLVTAATPAKRGEYLAIFVTGLGPTKTRIATGNAPSGEEAPTVETPQVLIGGVPARVLFSGLAPGLVGLYQINVELPFETYSGPGVPLQIRFGNLSADGTTIAIE
ncbi:MAG: hypothetical protein HY648_01570 [Acidobacteria bacterium]|nr:hypothetical protein [Acidobacteriota bacterium]